MSPYDIFAAFVAVFVGALSWIVLSVFRRGFQMASIPQVPRQSGVLDLVLGNLRELAACKYHRLGLQWTQQLGAIVRLRVLWSHVSSRLSLGFSHHARRCL